MLSWQLGKFPGGISRGEFPGQNIKGGQLLTSYYACEKYLPSESCCQARKFLLKRKKTKQATSRDALSMSVNATSK